MVTMATASGTATASRVASHESAAFPAQQLRSARKLLGLSQLAISVELGCASSQFGPWERGQSAPSPHSWYLLAAFLRRRGIEFPFPPGEDGSSTAVDELRVDEFTADLNAGEPDVAPDSQLANSQTRQRALAGHWATWSAWRNRVKLDGGRWHHRTLATGIKLGLRYNPPFAWEMSLEAFGDMLFEGMIRAALDLLFDNDVEVRPQQDDPHFYHAIVRTPELHCAWRDLNDATEVEALLDACRPQEAIA